MVANMMRPEQQLLSEQLRQLGKHLRGADIGKKPKSAMWGGVATWNRENASMCCMSAQPVRETFNILR